MLADVEASFDSYHGALDLRITQDIKEVFRASKAELARENAF